MDFFDLKSRARKTLSDWPRVCSRDLNPDLGQNNVTILDHVGLHLNQYNQ